MAGHLRPQALAPQEHFHHHNPTIPKHLHQIQHSSTDPSSSDTWAAGKVLHGITITVQC